MGRRRTLAALAIIAGAALVVVSLLLPEVSGGGRMGGGEERVTYGLLNIILVMLGTAVATGGAALLLTEDRRLSDPSVPRASSGGEEHEVAAEAVGTEAPKEQADDGRRLVLRLLSGDEREVFRTLLDAGGEALQKDLVNSTKMSDAKVSRVIDRLEGKGLVSRERQGMGNRVRVSIED